MWTTKEPCLTYIAATKVCCNILLPCFSPCTSHSLHFSFLSHLVSQILGLGCASPTRLLKCRGFSFLPSSEVNSTIYSKIKSMHALATGIMNAACNLEQSINGYKFAVKKLGLASSGGSPVEKICNFSLDGEGPCTHCSDHLFQHQCKL